MKQVTSQRLFRKHNNAFTDIRRLHVIYDPLPLKNFSLATKARVAANLARFKKDLEKKLKISKTIAELSIVLSFVFFKQ